MSFGLARTKRLNADVQTILLEASNQSNGNVKLARIMSGLSGRMYRGGKSYPASFFALGQALYNDFTYDDYSDILKKLRQ